MIQFDVEPAAAQLVLGLTDGLAATREVTLFNNAGISLSSGEVPTTFEEIP
jgi:hypothetical protein